MHNASVGNSKVITERNMLSNGPKKSMAAKKLAPANAKLTRKPIIALTIINDH